MRWCVFTGTGVAFDFHGAGGVGTVIGVAASAADTFVVEKLVSEWKPDQFVESYLRQLVAPGTSEKTNKSIGS